MPGETLARLQLTSRTFDSPIKRDSNYVEPSYLRDAEKAREMDKRRHESPGCNIDKFVIGDIKK